MKYKNFVIHDTNNLSNSDDNVYVFSALNKYAVCKGCFDCWLKTPGKCSMKDSVYGLSDYLAQTEVLTIITRCEYGGYSKEVKGVVDRLIAFNLPFFKKLNNELHHKPRYDNKLMLNVVFYGDDITEEERQTAINYVNATALNFNVSSVDIKFCKEEEVTI